MAKLTIMHNHQFVAEWIVTDEVVIGRDPQCSIPLDDPAVSRHHAKILRGALRSQQTYLIEDLNSTNGVLLNGDTVHKRMLKEGDVIRIGHHEIYFTEQVVSPPEDISDDASLLDSTAALQPTLPEPKPSAPTWLQRFLQRFRSG